MKKIYFIALCSLVLQFPSYASSSDFLDFKSKSIMGATSCNFNGKKAHLFLTSPSGELGEDDMSVWITNEDGKGIAVDFGGTAWFDLEPGSEGAFYENWPENTEWADWQSACVRTLAVPLDNGVFAVLLGHNARPGSNGLAVFIYDPQKHEILASDTFLGHYASHKFTWWDLVRTKDGFAFKNVSYPTDYDGCDGDCGTLKKQKISSISEKPTDSWLKVSYAQAKLNVSKDPELSWEKSDLQKFFKNRSDFEKALDGVDFIYTAHLEDGTECLLAQKGREWRDADSSKWICPKPKK